MTKKIVFIAALLIIVIVGLVSLKFVVNTKSKVDVVHYHAGFQVYMNGEIIDFSDLKFMHDKPCTLDGKPTEDEHEDEQIEKAHLHDLVGDVVHVHRKNVIWVDLFTNLKYEIPENAEFYINEEKISTGTNTSIKAYESLSIFIGENPNKSEHLENRATKKHILDAEKRSETCGS